MHTLLMMANKTLSFTTRAKTYKTNLDKQPSECTSSLPLATSPYVSNGSLQIEKPISDSVLRPPKGKIWKSTFNPNYKDAQNYNIVEDLA